MRIKEKATTPLLIRVRPRFIRGYFIFAWVPVWQPRSAGTLPRMPRGSPSKIAVVGAGSVGATIAYACMVRGVGQQIVLYDVNRQKVDAEVLDLNHGLQFVPMATIEGSDDLGICADADVVVVTAGAKQKPGQTRLDLAAANTAICRKIIPELTRLAPHAVLLLVTNPVDVVTYAALKITGW